MKKLLKLLFAISFCSLVSCATKLPDFRGCSELAINKGYCVNSVTGFEQVVDDTHFLKNPDGSFVLDPDGKKQTWFDLRPQMIQIPFFDYVEIKKFIIDQCRQNRSACDSTVSSWNRSLENLEKVTEEK